MYVSAWRLRVLKLLLQMRFDSLQGHEKLLWRHAFWGQNLVAQKIFYIVWRTFTKSKFYKKIIFCIINIWPRNSLFLITINHYYKTLVKISTFDFLHGWSFFEVKTWSHEKIVLYCFKEIYLIKILLKDKIFEPSIFDFQTTSFLLHSNLA